MASLLAALALGFGVVVGTAISPNLAGIVAAPAPPVVAQAPPAAPAPVVGGGGGSSPAPAQAAAGTPTFGPTSPTSSPVGGGGGGGGGKQKKQKQQPPSGITFSGTVVRANPVAQSYTISTSGGLIAIHADTLPQVGAQVESEVRKLNNGTYAEEGSRNPVGNADVASIRGTVTYCTDLEHPNAPCDGSVPDDHYVYAVSSLGASVLVSWPHSSSNPPPSIGSQVQVGVSIGAEFKAIDPGDPADWSRNADCTPPYDEQNGLPSPPAATNEITQTSLTVSGQASSATLESVVQAKCPGDAQTLVLSADDVREAGRDLAPLDLPSGFDPSRLAPGQAVQVAVDVAAEGGLTLKGITSDQGAAGGDDATQGQGTLTGS